MGEVKKKYFFYFTYLKIIIFFSSLTFFFTSPQKKWEKWNKKKLFWQGEVKKNFTSPTFFHFLKVKKRNLFSLPPPKKNFKIFFHFSYFFLHFLYQKNLFFTSTKKIIFRWRKWNKKIQVKFFSLSPPKKFFCFNSPTPTKK